MSVRNGEVSGVLRMHKYLSLALNVDVKIGNVASFTFKQAVTRPGELSTKISGLEKLRIQFALSF